MLRRMPPSHIRITLAYYQWLFGVTCKSTTDNQPSPEEQSKILGALRYRYIGPVGNRTSRRPACRASEHHIVGAASGGIFKTYDAARIGPRPRGQPVASIGHSWTPSIQRHLAGTGEAWIRATSR